MAGRQLRIGISCFPTVGGSGIVATEIGLAMAKRGHRVHFISSGIPGRLNMFTENVFFHEVETHEYPLFNQSLYTLNLASKMVEVFTYEELDLLHVHYAIPHATSAYLARQMMHGKNAPRIITTLHGTDITLVGNKRSYLPITRFSIEQSDGVTTPSKFLKAATYDKLNVSSKTLIQVIPNFIDTTRYKPLESKPNLEIEPTYCGKPRAGHCTANQGKTLMHVSNFRAIKRLDDVIAIFERVQSQIPSRLVLVGDGPERSRIETLVRDKGLREHVCFLGNLDDFLELLQRSDVFLLPSESENFSLAALEALSCGIPVVGSNIGGMPELVQHGKTGFLSKVGDVDEMAKNVVQLLSDPEQYQVMSKEARKTVVENWGLEQIVQLYEDYYFKILGPIQS